MHEVWKRKQVHEGARKMYRTEILVELFMESVPLKVMIWCRKCSGNAKLMNCCKPEHGKMSKRIQVLEDGRLPVKEGRSWRIGGQKGRITGKKYRIFLNEFEMRGFMAQKEGLWSLEREKVLQDRRELLEEEGDVIREYKAVHEETFLEQLVKERWKRERRRNGGNGHGDQRRDGQKEEVRSGERRERDGEIWRVVVVFLGVTFSEKPDDLYDCERVGRMCLRCGL